MQITSEIFQVGGEGLTTAEDAAVYLIHFGAEAALVDAGCGDSLPKLLSHVRARGVEPEQLAYILLTHCHYDHTGGAAALRKLTGALVVAHEVEAPFLEQGDTAVTAASWYGALMPRVPVDRRLAGARSEIWLGGRVIQALHIPGHSPGSVAYVTISEGLTVLFGQDVHGPLAPSLLSDRAQYRTSLELLLSLEADILCEGHYGVYRGKKEVARFIQGFLRG